MRRLFLFLCIAFAVPASVFGQDPADSARYLYIQYQQSRDSGNFVRSEILLEQILERDFHLPDYNLALVRNALGYIYYETGQLDAALNQYHLAEELASGSDPRVFQLRISIQINRGLLYNGLADYTNALVYNSEAIRLLNQIPDPDERSNQKLSATLLNKGIALYHLERYQEALEVLKECILIKETRGHSYLGSAYFNMARVFQRLGDPGPAGGYYIRSIEQWTAEYDSAYYELANIYLHYGQFLSGNGEPEKGKVYLQKALRNYQKNYGELHSLTAACYEYLARYSLDQDSVEDALNYLQMALHSVTGEPTMKDYFSTPDIQSSAHDLTLLEILATKAEALAQAAAGKRTTREKTEYVEAALAANTLSIEVYQSIQRDFLSPESRVFMTSQQKDLFSTGIRLNLEMYRLSDKEIYKERAFLMAAKGKSAELLYELNNKEWLYLESLSDTMVMGTIELRKQMNHLSNLIRTRTMELSPDSSTMEAWRDQLFQTRDSFNRNMEELKNEFPQISQFESANPEFSIDRIRRNLRRNETLVEYFLTGQESAGQQQLYIFVVSKNQCHFHRSTPDAAFQKNMEVLIGNIHNYVPYQETRERFDSLTLSLFEIYQELIQPVEPFLEGKDLLIVPDEKLSYIPFDALISRLDPDSKTNYAGLAYLVRDYNISYMYNSLLIKHRHYLRWHFPKVTAWIPEQSSTGTGGAGKLDGAEEEVQDILRLVKGRRIQQSPGKTELAGIFQENSILHLAMHSLATEDSYGSPYFILDTIKDPLLANQMHDYEINALSVSTPMVVLSSCETAGGHLYRGEGIMSLSRSFLQAGASSVVHTLWPVDDAKSSEVMVAYYTELKKGLSKSRALAKAKQHYLIQQPPFYTHPYYWAAFQITGDPSPLQTRRSIALFTGAVLITLLIFLYLKRRSFLRRV